MNFKITSLNNGTDYKLELWETNTEFTGIAFYYHDWEDRLEFLNPSYQVFQWLLYCASCLTFPSHALQLAEIAMREWVLEDLN